jgi:hypothetical protein
MIQEIIQMYVDIFAKIFRLLELPGFKTEQNAKSIDERISKIDLAKKNLLESLSAIDELKTEAENNKLEFEKTINDLNRIKTDKSTLETEYDSLKQLSTKELNSLKTLIGIPDKNKERLIGFVSGIVASLIASGIIFLITYWV